MQKALQIIGGVEANSFTDMDDQQVRCPNCDFTEFYSGFKCKRGLKGILIAIISLLLFVFPFYYKAVYNAGHEVLIFKQK
ncbi:hypothetical protein JMN32_15975 [Fulvivirga sp. 29W222]|uniref:Uncharacterized protein n=1 Tax=Fulvivirga marina TaxID=2494733 RepID=A0A937G0F4_9BACT|nr:hypothetical protein [Fulvivirga marina]MBL6447818.1 hypothetical protein [Fulvivirga marina]